MMKKELVAPCGINCGVCKYYHREKNTCPGCRTRDENKPDYCLKCIIVNCEKLKKTKSGFCFECPDFPCKRLKNLDKRYKIKYHMSLLENQKYFKKKGMMSFLKREKKKWRCTNCDGIVTCHGGICLNCGYKKFRDK
jgi:hypothetical protein